MPHLGDARSAKSAFRPWHRQADCDIYCGERYEARCIDMGSCWRFYYASHGGRQQATATCSGKRERFEECVFSLLPIPSMILIAFSVTGVAPWVTRIAEVKAALAVNIEAERKVASLNDEMQGLVRTLRVKGQNIQEATVKNELMERCMETVKKQADTLVGLETEINKGKEQERAYEEAIEQLQADIDAIEQENARLKSLSAGQEWQRMLILFSF